MSGKVIPIEVALPHTVYRDTCNACGYSCISVAPVKADPTKLECARCGAQDSTAVPLDRDGRPVE